MPAGIPADVEALCAAQSPTAGSSSFNYGLQSANSNPRYSESNFYCQQITRDPGSGAIVLPAARGGSSRRDQTSALSVTRPVIGGSTRAASKKVR